MNTFTTLAAMLLLATAGSAGAAELGDNCTASLAQGSVLPTDCSINAQFQGKQYCFGSQQAKDRFLQDPQAMVDKARQFYASVAEPERQKLTQQQALAQINSQHCDLSNKDLGYLEFDKLDLRHCDMTNTSFFGAYLRGADLSGAKLQHAYLNLARLEGTNLSHADLRDATIFQAIFDKTNFKGANLAHARMIGTLGNVDMSDANVAQGRFGLDIGNQPMGAMRFDAVGGNFAHSNFQGADINRSNLRFADLRGADLSHTDLFRADLSKADLTDADITGANLKEAVLDGTVMTGVKGVEAIQGYDSTKGQCVDCATRPLAQDSAAEPAPKPGPAKLAAECVRLQQQRQSVH